MRLLTGAFTAALYAVFVFAAVVLLAAVQIRSTGGLAFDTWKVNVDSSEAAVKTQTEELGKAVALQSENQDQLAFVNGCLTMFFDSSGNALPVSDEARQAVAVAMEKYGAKGTTDLEKVSGEARCLLQGYFSLQDAKQFYVRTADASSRKVQELQRSLQASSERLTTLKRDRDDFIAFRAMRLSLHQLPYDLLLMLLVLTMGWLGGMVRLLRDYGSTNVQNPSANDYLVIPAIGAVVAIGGFVLAKTGLLLLSSSGGEASLSLYMISLVGIVSGLLAREVIETIASNGRNFLRRPEAPRNEDGTRAEAGAHDESTKEATPIPIEASGQNLPSDGVTTLSDNPTRDRPEHRAA